MFTIKQNDTLPKLECQLFDYENTPINLELCGVKFHMVDKINVVKVSRDVEIVDLKNGNIRFIWKDGDTSESGLFKGEFEVNLPNGDIITFPNDGYFTINIVPELN